MTTAAIVLASRMLIVAAIVVSVSVVAARSGPVLGAMLATLPVSTGPAYVYLAADHGPDFIVQGTVPSILGVAATGVFVAVHNLMARIAGTFACLVVSLAACIATLVVADRFSWNLAWAIAAGVGAVLAAMVVTREARRTAAPFALPGRSTDLLVRAAAVMTVVAAVTILGEVAGPRVAGYAALMPVVFMSFILVMQPRVGGAAIAGLFAHALFGILGFIPALVAINLLTGPLGVWWALALGLLTTICWNAGVIVLRRAGLLRV